MPMYTFLKKYWQFKIIGPMSSISQKKYLLMYHDMRFQTDPGFSLIAFNQEQIQQSSSAGFVTAEKPYFVEVAKRLMTLNKSVLDYESYL
jgi:hypothetical protein